MRNENAFSALRRSARLPLGRVLWLLGLVAFLSSTFYPSDMASYMSDRGISRAPGLARATERYGRFINPVIQGGLPLVLGDREGLLELARVAVVTTLATHVLKHGLNRVHVGGTRLGERPSGGDLNMPSGHSSMASSGAYFVTRRYGWRWGLVLIPIMLLTMFARVSLDEHTVSAVLSGALLGLLCTALFTTRWRGGLVKAPADAVCEAG